MRHQIAHGFYTAASLYSQRRAIGDAVGLAFPDTPTFRTYLGRLEADRAALGIQVFLVKPDRTVEAVPSAVNSNDSDQEGDAVMPPTRTYQRDVMRRLYREHSGDEDLVIRAYADAERRGEVQRESNTHQLDALAYARALLNDGVRKGWIYG